MTGSSSLIYLHCIGYVPLLYFANVMPHLFAVMDHARSRESSIPGPLNFGFMHVTQAANGLQRFTFFIGPWKMVALAIN